MIYVKRQPRQATKDDRLSTRNLVGDGRQGIGRGVDSNAVVGEGQIGLGMHGGHVTFGAGLAGQGSEVLRGRVARLAAGVVVC